MPGNKIMKVNTKEFAEIADRMDSTVKRADRLFAEMDRMAAGTAFYWAGLGEEEHILVLRKCSRCAKQSLTSLKETVKDLKTIAGIYEETESKAVAEAGELPGNVIE